jgi:hypothetical protein
LQLDEVIVLTQTTNCLELGVVQFGLWKLGFTLEKIGVYSWHEKLGFLVDLAAMEAQVQVQTWRLHILLIFWGTKMT